MYAFIRGKLSHATPSEVTLETHGIGYLITIPVSVYGKLPALGKELALYTSLVIRENSHALYGFLGAHDRDCFETLLAISGIGPKTALNIVGHLGIRDLHTAVASGDVPSLCKIPGIGRKTAERLLVEMRDKLQALLPPDDANPLSTFPTDPRAQTIRDAMSALINLGYNQAIAQKAIKNSLSELPEKIDLSSLITAALKNV